MKDLKSDFTDLHDKYYNDARAEGNHLLPKNSGRIISRMSYMYVDAIRKVVPFPDTRKTLRKLMTKCSHKGQTEKVH
ncbi:MAG: hypothetical protein PHI90_06525 [Clostridia bacterium]|nr:hypothetical protein [Clostridia bacterium]MDD4048465.1 hypothetical protein [Clostridia bacterium]